MIKKRLLPQFKQKKAEMTDKRHFWRKEITDKLGFLHWLDIWTSIHWSDQTISSNNRKYDSTYGQYQNQTDYVLCSRRWRSSTQSAKTRPGADCGSDHEFLGAKFRLKLKKVGKTTRPFMDDLNQIPMLYSGSDKYRFKGLDLIECLKNYGQRFVTLNRKWWSKPSSRKKKSG